MEEDFVTEFTKKKETNNTIFLVCTIRGRKQNKTFLRK